MALGDRLATAGVIASPEDVFWLTEDEIDGAVYAHSWDHDLAPRVAERKAAYGAYEASSLGAAWSAPE